MQLLSRHRSSRKDFLPTPNALVVFADFAFPYRPEQVPSDAMSTPRAFGRHALSTQDVFAARNWLKMAWIDACSIAAEMVNGQPFRDRPNQLFVRPPVCPLDPSPTFSTEVEPAIAPRQSGRPDPARPKVRPPLWNRAVLVDLCPKAVRWVADLSSLCGSKARALVRAKPLGSDLCFGTTGRDKILVALSAIVHAQLY